MVKFDDVGKAMAKHGIPSGELNDLPTSRKTFPDGANYRLEISGIERPGVLSACIDEMDKRKVPVHRLISTVMGATLLSKKELREFAQMAHDANTEVIITPGPRNLWDIGAQVKTPEGGLSGLRLHGVEGLKHIIADMKRCIDVGFRGFLVTDEGLLWLLTQMKKKGDIPEDVTFKVSVFAGHANPAGGKVLEMLGAGTFNPVGDLTLAQLASIRYAIDIPMDLHVYLFDSFGGFCRFYETPEMARIASPCYFKIEPGPSVTALYKPWVAEASLAEFAREKVKYAETIREFVEENQPKLKLSTQKAKGLAVPMP